MDGSALAPIRPPMPRRLRLARASRLAPAFLATLALAACRPSVSIRYTVALPDPAQAQLRITADLDRVPRDSLVLLGLMRQGAFRPSAFEARGADGAPHPARFSVDSISIEGRAVAVPRVVIDGPLPPRLSVRYGVTPGVREGDTHMGFTGVRYGYVGPRFALVTGRSLFLLPAPAEAIRDIRVRFELPRGWRAVTPWRAEGDGFHPELHGDFAAEHLVASTIGLGSFRERTFPMGRTTCRVAFESSVPDSVVARSERLIERAARSVHSVFDRDLGPGYRVIATPEASDGDEIRGEAWGTGQGGTLVPVTAGRLAQFSQSLLSAYVRDAPYRVELHAREEYWLVDGIERLYAWRAVAAAGLVDADAIERGMAVSYVNGRKVAGSSHDLERLYGSGHGTELVRDVDAPFMLGALDRELRAGSRGRETLDGVIRQMFRSRPAGSLWATLRRDKARDWNAFREKYVRGVEPAPAARYFPLEPTHPSPDPPAGPAVRRLPIVFTGDTNGFLEHCGCKVNQSGGVARRATVLERLRHANAAALLLDAGNAFLRPEKMSALDFLSREEQRLYLRTEALARYDAMAVGMNELAFGPEAFLDATRGLALPYVCANVSESGRPLASASRIVRSHGVRVGIVGLLEPPQGPGTLRQFETHTAGLEFEDPITALRREMDRLRGRADVIVAIGRMTPVTIRRLAGACPTLDLIVTTASETHIEQAPDAASNATPPDDQGFLGRTLVLYEDSRNYGLESVDLVLDSEGRIASARTLHHWLFQDVPDSPPVRAMLSHFYDRVGTIDSAQASVRPLFADSPERLNGVYVGAKRCAACHDAEHRQWATTAHATAFKTLLDAHRHYQPRCVVCHVVGFGTRTGYRIGAPEQPLGNVQCEACHGPGAAHAAHPTAARLAGPVTERVCLECHTPDHSDHFVYADKLPLVVHGRTGAVSLAEPYRGGSIIVRRPSIAR